MKRAFVAGWPIAHSRSPQLHGHWLDKHGIDGTYEAKAVPPEDFARFADELKAEGYVGGNFTIPHKEAAFARFETRSEAAEIIGAVNTVWVEAVSIHADNTDAYGFAANLDDGAPVWRAGSQAVVMGAGGASRAVVHALLEAGYGEVKIVNRTLERARALTDRFGVRVSAHAWDTLAEHLMECDLLVNTTSIGMRPETDPPVPDLSGMKDKAVVTDIVYTPLVTPLLEAAVERQLKTVDGLGMLLHQAVPGFEKWFGVKPEVTPALRRKILGDT